MLQVAVGVGEFRADCANFVDLIDSSMRVIGLLVLTVVSSLSRSRYSLSSLACWAPRLIASLKLKVVVGGVDHLFVHTGDWW